ncbi:MAG: hypothetical protein LBM19_01255 [Holosporales bacterium]|nr:hypothetical protein [Holosporales bacterium]
MKILILTIFFALGNLGECSSSAPKDSRIAAPPLYTEGQADLQDRASFNIGEIVHSCIEEETPSFAIDQKLQEFKSKYPRLDFGIKSMENLYDLPNPSAYYGRMTHSAFIGNTVFGIQLLVGAACSVIKCFSIAHPESSIYGEILTGLYVGKGISWGLGTYLENHFGKPILDLINEFNPEAKSKMTLSDISSFVPGIETDKLIDIATSVIANTDVERLDEGDRLMLTRLSTLTEQIGKGEHSKKTLLTIGKSLSLLAGGLTGLSGAVSKMINASFWLNLTSCGLDSVFDNIEGIRREGKAMQKYAAISEIIFLSEHFLANYGQETV